MNDMVAYLVQRLGFLLVDLKVFLSVAGKDYDLETLKVSWTENLKEIWMVAKLAVKSGYDLVYL